MSPEQRAIKSDDRFQLVSMPYSPAYMKGRIGVVQAFLARPVWTTKSVGKADRIVNRLWWEDHPEWDDVLELARGLIDEWQRIDNMAPEGSLRHALKRPSRYARAERLYEKCRKHERWLRDRIKKQIGYKECKTMAARRKWWAKLEAATSSDPFIARLKRWEKDVRKIKHS